MHTTSISTDSQQTVETLLADLKRLPSLPNIVVQLLDLLETPNSNLDSIAQRIAEDQAMTSEILRIANSAMYGMTGQVTSIQRGIAILGFHQVRMLAVVASITDRLQVSHEAGFDTAQFWLHSMRSAFYAQQLARMCGESPYTAFTAGLLHDIGQLAMVSAKPLLYRRVTDLYRTGTILLQAAETSIFSLDHCAVGHVLAQRWQFANSITHAIAYHHAPNQPTPQRITDIIHITDMICRAFERQLADDPPQDLCLEAMQRLQLQWSELPPLMHALPPFLRKL